MSSQRVVTAHKMPLQAGGGLVGRTAGTWFAGGSFQQQVVSAMAGEGLCAVSHYWPGAQAAHATMVAQLERVKVPHGVATGALKGAMSAGVLWLLGGTNTRLLAFTVVGGAVGEMAGGMLDKSMGNGPAAADVASEV